jgi:hypothetical protein
MLKGGITLGRKRQIPKIKDICANRGYNDLVYGYLQTISDNNGRIKKLDMNFREIGEKVGLTRQTVGTRVKNLLEMELLFLDAESGDYELTLLEPYVAALIPVETIRVLVNTMNERSISVYVYLFIRYYAAKKPFFITYAELKEFVGLSSRTRSNDTVIQDILTVLQKLGLIDYEFVSMGYKSKYQINKVNLTFN